MTTLTPNELHGLVAEYLELKAQAGEIKYRQDVIRHQLKVQMEKREVGELVTTAGSAQMVTRSASVSFPAVHVLSLASVWVDSVDPVLKQCGELLMRTRQDRPASTYVRITAP